MFNAGWRLTVPVYCSRPGAKQVLSTSRDKTATIIYCDIVGLFLFFLPFSSLIKSYYSELLL